MKSSRSTSAGPGKKSTYTYLVPIITNSRTDQVPQKTEKEKTKLNQRRSQNPQTARQNHLPPHYQYQVLEACDAS